jgi:hypothetical protein
MKIRISRKLDLKASVLMIYLLLDVFIIERNNFMNEITLQSVISAKKEIVAADMDGDTVMMSIAAGKYYNLGKMGGVIWGLIAESVAVETVVAKLLEQYEVTREQCEAEVLAFLNEIKQEWLLEIQ